MIRFLFKGILRDKNRSVLPIIVVTLGVILTVFLSTWIKGIFTDMIDINANFSTGHVKVATAAYFESTNAANDLALLDVDELVTNLKTDFPTVDWNKRINFGGLLDVADENGETRAQGPAAGQAVDLFSPDSKEAERMNIINSIVKGQLPSHAGEALISDDFAERFNVAVGEEVTLFGSTMYGSMMFYNFVVSGTVRFGNQLLDRGAIIVDITDAQIALDMENAAGEIFGFLQEGYDTEIAEEVKVAFNAKYYNEKDEFSPKMEQLNDQNGLSEYLVLIDSMSGIMSFIFIFAMSIVLWNTGLLGGLRRYTEFGIRLALGEEKKHIYRSLIYEAILIGLIGSIIGSAIGLGLGYWVQNHGLQLGASIQGGSMMMPTVFRTMVTPEAFYIGFIPGLLAMVIGNALSGVAIYKRQTAQLFKELEV
ncbi:MAG: FtsX-like permease family protein [Prolixibacteraceae bacterium]|jgi:putative ABC transport system permease protein|nr:FtsX-like permease family protein [Prolixibacteraceae bacterium]